MAKKYHVQLTEGEQEELKGLVSKGRAAGYRQTHARILLLCDENQVGGAMRDEAIVWALKVGAATVERVRRRCVAEGLERALGRKEQLEASAEAAGRSGGGPLGGPGLFPTPGGPDQLDAPSAGGSVGGAGDSGKHQHRDGAPVSEKTRLKPWLRGSWCIPPKANAELVCAMADVLEVYHRQLESNEVLVCLDETSKQPVQATRQPLPAWPGMPAGYDYEYRRNGVNNLFLGFAPWDGWRRVEVTERRTKAHWTRVLRKLVDEDYPEKDRSVLVMDNLNTHHPASLYQGFEPAEARRIAERLEIHYTPKHGSWLNLAETEWAVLAKQCLDRRIPSQDIPEHQTRAWQDQRNREAIQPDWRFTTEDARIKLKSLYPSIQH